MTKNIVGTTELNNQNAYALQLGQLSVKNWGSFVLLQTRANVIKIGAASLFQFGAGAVTNLDSYYKLRHPLLENMAAITNWVKMYYKLGQELQIRAIITNWCIKTKSQRI